LNGTRARPLKVGLQLPEAERVAPWSDLLAMARRAEEVGFDSLWVGDHLLYRYPGEEPRGPWEAWSLLAALAAVTSRVELGPLVACTSFHNPALLAKKAATVDEISGGRLILGLGSGWHEPEYRAFGFPYDHRLDRFTEAFTIVRTLLREGEIDFAGEYYEARECELRPRGPRPGGPPLMIGSRGDRLLRVALPYVDAWNAWYAWMDNRIARYEPFRAQVDAACRDVGRDPETVERTVAMLVGVGDTTGRLAGDITERGVRALTGTPEELADAIRAYARAGIGHVQLVLVPNTLAAIEAFAPVLEILDRG